MTPAEVESFQRTPRLVDGVLAPPADWWGKPLRVDGDLGPRTRWALYISRLDPRRQSIVQRACSKVGECETVANRGPWPDFVLRRCGYDVPDDPRVPLPNAAWCAAHASWCMSVEGLPERRELGARNLAQSMRRPAFVLPGDFGCFPTGTWQMHIFPIVACGPGEVLAPEGNHGNRVALVRRRLSEIQIVTPFPVEELPPLPMDVPLVPVQVAGTR